MPVTAPMGCIQHPSLGFLLRLTSRWLCTQIASLRPCSAIPFDVLSPTSVPSPSCPGAHGALASPAGRALHLRRCRGAPPDAGRPGPFPAPPRPRLRCGPLSRPRPPSLPPAGRVPSFPRGPPPARPSQRAAPPGSSPAPGAPRRTRCSAGPVASAPVGKSSGPRPRDGVGPAAAAAAALALRPHTPERG